MTFIISLIVSLFLALPVYATQIQMGSEGNLVFSPNEVSISVGDTVTFVNGDLPPHNMVIYHLLVVRVLM